MLKENCGTASGHPAPFQTMPECVFMALPRVLLPTGIRPSRLPITFCQGYDHIHQPVSIRIPDDHCKARMDERSPHPCSSATHCKIFADGTNTNYIDTYIVFKNQHSYVKASASQAENIPVGEQVTILALAKDNNGFFITIARTPQSPPYASHPGDENIIGTGTAGFTGSVVKAMKL